MVVLFWFSCHKPQKTSSHDHNGSETLCHHETDDTITSDLIVEQMKQSECLSLSLSTLSVSLLVMDFYCIPVWWPCSCLLIAKCHFVLPSVCFRLFSPLSEVERQAQLKVRNRLRGRWGGEYGRESERERGIEGETTALEVKVSSENEELSHLEFPCHSACWI